MTNQTQLSNKFNIGVTAAGYVNRIREVTPKKGSPYWSCTIGALRGDKDSPEYTYFDVSVVGSLAKERIKELFELQESGQDKIFASVKMGDIYPEHFELKKGKNAGKICDSIKGRLLRIDYASVAGETFEFQAQPSEPAAIAEESPQGEPDSDKLKEIMQLDPTDDRYETQKEWLSNNGYVETEKPDEWRKAS